MTINTRNEHKPKHERKLTKPSVPLKNQFNTWLGWSRTVLIFSALKNLIYNRQNQGKPNISVGVNIFLKSYKTKKVLLFHFTPRASKINIYIYNKNVKTIVFFSKKNCHWSICNFIECRLTMHLKGCGEDKTSSYFL